MQLKNQRSGKRIVSYVSFLTELLPVLSFEKTILNIAHDTKELSSLFYAGGCYHIERSPLMCCANQWTDFYMATASVMRELISENGFAVIYDYYKGTFTPLRKKYYSPVALWHRCFPVNFAKFLRTPFLQNTSCGYFWTTESGARRSSNWANVWQTSYLVNISRTNFNVFIDLSNIKFLFL